MTNEKQQSKANTSIIDTKMSRRKLLGAAGTAMVAGAFLGGAKAFTRQIDDVVDSENENDTLNLEERGGYPGIIAEFSAMLSDIVINVKLFGATGNGVADDTHAIRAAIESIRTTGGTVFFPRGTYRCRAIVVPANITIIGNHAVIKAKDVFYTKTTSSVYANGTSITVQNSGGINVGDVISLKSNVTDLIVVTGKTGNTIQIKPMRIVKGIAETHTGFKYDHSSGADFVVLPQIFWVTQGLTTDSDSADNVPKTGGVENVTFKGIKFVGSKNSHNYSKFTLYELIGSGSIFFYRTTNCNVRDCIFEDTYSSSVLYYGWNTNFEFRANTCSNVGYVIPTSVSPQLRDSTTGFSMHWDQRYDTQTSLHVSDSYVIENNTFNHCWNGGVFASATNNGSILNNDVNGFVSHGICVYGGDLGIGSSAVIVSNNKVRNGRNDDDPLGYGMGIWLSIMDRTSVTNNLIDNCEKGIVLNGTSNMNIANNVISNCMTSFIELTLRNVSVNVSDNVFIQEYGKTSKPAARVHRLDSSDSANDNINLVFQSNLYTLSPSAFQGSHVTQIIKSNDTLFIDERGSTAIPFASISDTSSPKKPKMMNCDFTGMGGSGVTTGQAWLLNCLESDGTARTDLDTSVMTYNSKEVAVVSNGSTGTRPTGVPIGYAYFDTTLDKPVWWNGSNWKDSTGATV